ncbi:DEAD/DEAH box helicase [Halonatronum saccharophilum]|uniref:DEAD/DEAH box helicase n=1 Tax=Halonatronum saccharophilum TaxID=150060 RepID=UPI00047F5810|nr:DEAD/DEAH box helicase [Halonatronum saccharophilum]
MEANKPLVYILADEYRYIIGLSTRVDMEVAFHLNKGVIKEDEYSLFIVAEFINWGIGDYIYNEITEDQEKIRMNFDSDGFSLGKFFSLFWEVDPLGGLIQTKLRKIKSVVRREGIEKGVKIKGLEVENIGRIRFPDPVEWKQVYSLLQGRVLYFSEVRDLLRQNHIVVRDLNSILIYLKLLGKLEIIPAIRKSGEQIKCERCGSEEKLVEMECNSCGELDYYCQDCILMGEARLCRPLYRCSSSSFNRGLKLVTPRLKFDLTTLQARISNGLVGFLDGNLEEALVWAVCGAGKTEVVFAAIADVLSRGGRVLFAIPRRDVVVELAQRLQASFPDVRIKALYGGSKSKYKDCDLIIATTHQVMRFYRAFDLIILDEVDAFPYKGSKTLRRAINLAKKDKGKIIYMTATPTEDEFIRLDKGEMKLLKLSARYHRHPLPEPMLIESEIDYNRGDGRLLLAEDIVEKIKLSVEGELAQVFVFVPSRELVEVVVERLKDYFPEGDGLSWVRGSHSKDKLREEKREAFLAGDYPILVSTTIMERGVTVEKANVFVLFAHWEWVFSEGVLIQMAGRAGRSLKYPEGKVFFIGSEISSEMRAAKERIRALNEESRQKGYIN